MRPRGRARPCLVTRSAGVTTGSGTLNLGGATLTNDGTLRPGGTGAVGSLAITGNYAQGSGGVLDTDLQSAASYDVVAISGTAALDGTLNGNYLGGYGPAGGATHAFMTYSSAS